MTGVKAVMLPRTGCDIRSVLRCRSELLEGLGWDPETIDGIIFISQSPDIRCPRLPAPAAAPGNARSDDRLTSTWLFGHPYGLWLAMSLIQTGAMDRVLIAVGDINTRANDPLDRSVAMLAAIAVP